MPDSSENNSSNHDRRRFLQSAAISLAAGGTLIQQTSAAEPTAKRSESAESAENAKRRHVLNPSFSPFHQVRPLPFKSSSLRGLSTRLIDSHWSNNYAGSVRALNACKKKLAESLAGKDTPNFLYNGLKREHLIRTGSVILHELYFDNLGGNGIADATVRSTIGAGFGEFSTWEAEFRRIAAGLGGGSGWVVFGYNTHFATLENYWLADHTHGPATTVPLLVLDMYEHSYHLDYGTATAKYIDAFFENINWEMVAQRMAG